MGSPKGLGADQWVILLCTSRPNLLVSHFLIHSYLYYELDSPVILDATFRWLVGELSQRWDSLEHPHKRLIDPSLLKTGYYLRYPITVINAALSLRALFP